MAINDSDSPASPAGSSAPDRVWVRRTCPKVTPPKPPKWIRKNEAVGGRCNYIAPDDSLCSHWRAKDSLACPCHIEAYEGPDSTAGMRAKRIKKPNRGIRLLGAPDPDLWRGKDPL